VLTIHTAPLLRLTPDDPDPLAEGAVAVTGERVAAIGPLAELQAAYPQARIRRWPGVLGPALTHQGPLPDAPTPRERVHALLRLGVSAVPAGRVTDPELLTALRRNGVVVSAGPPPPALRPSGRADLAVFTADGGCVATVLAGRLVHRRA
jgi:hypothetical protein